MSDPVVSMRGASLPPLMRGLIAAACLVVILAGIKAVTPTLTPFLVALLLAQVLSPLMRFLMRHRVPRWLAVTLTLLIVFIGGAVVVGMVGASVAELSHRLPEYGTQLAALRDNLFARLQRAGIDTSGFSTIDALDPAAMLGPAASIAGTILSELGHSFFVMVITALLLIELAILFKALDEADHTNRTLLIRFGEMSADLQKYIGITAMVGLVGSVMYTVLLIAAGVPYIPTWVVLYFLLGFIPVIGGVIAIIPVVLITLLEHGVQRALTLLAVFAVLNFLLGDILKPRFMQRGFEISIVAVFFSLVFWNWLLGPIGMVLAVPVTITLRKLIQEFAPEVRRVMVD
ncbi:MAG: AI-2E family transporter [Gemmatimonadota bacterium]